MTKIKDEINDLKEFTNCEHKKKGTLNPDCIHCNFDWCLSRIKYLEKLTKPREIDEEKVRDKISILCKAVKREYLAEKIAHAIATSDDIWKEAQSD